jgi:putative membrane protein
MKKTLLMLAAAAAVLVTLVPAGAATTSAPLDRHWLVQSGRTDLFQIAGARIAAARATSPAVKQLATSAEGNNAKALTSTGRVATGLGVHLAGTPTATQHWELHVLTTLSGAQFDRMYSWLEESHYVEAIADAQEVAARGSNAAARALARSQLPTLRAQLQLATAAKKAAG